MKNIILLFRGVHARANATRKQHSKKRRVRASGPIMPDDPVASLLLSLCCSPNNAGAARAAPGAAAAALRPPVDIAAADRSDLQGGGEAKVIWLNIGGSGEDLL